MLKCSVIIIFLKIYFAVGFEQNMTPYKDGYSNADVPSYNNLSGFSLRFEMFY